MPYCNNPGVPVTINIFTKLQEILKTPPPQELKACEANCSAAMLEIEANYLVTMLEIPVIDGTACMETISAVSWDIPAIQVINQSNVADLATQHVLRQVG